MILTFQLFACHFDTSPAKVESIAGHNMMTSSNENIFRVTGPLCGEFTGHRRIPHTKAGDAELWCLCYLRVNKRLSLNNREAGDLRRQRAHYDIIVIKLPHRSLIQCKNATSRSNQWHVVLSKLFTLPPTTYQGQKDNLSDKWLQLMMLWFHTCWKIDT